MKWYILILMTILLTPFAFGMEECQRETSIEDIPCVVINTWFYPNSCETYSVDIYNQSGVLLEQLNLTERGQSGFCEFNFTQSKKGTYVYNISSGDTGTIVVGVKSYMLAIVLGIGLVCAFFFWFAFQLSEEYIILKYLITIVAMGFLTLIPTVFITNDVSSLFFKYFLWFGRLLALYIFVFGVYKLLTYLGVIVPGENKNNE